MFSSGGRARTAEWIYDPRRRHATPADEGAAMLSLPQADLPPELARRPGEATVTPLQPRFSTASAPGGRPARRMAEAPPRRTDAAPPAERGPDPEPPAEPELRQPPAAAEEESHGQADPAPGRDPGRPAGRRRPGQARAGPVLGRDHVRQLATARLGTTLSVTA